MAIENFSMRDVIKYGLITLGHAMRPDLYSFAEDLPFHTWVALVLPTVMERVGLADLLTTAVRTLAKLDGPKEWSGDLSLMPAAATGNGEYRLGTPNFFGGSVPLIGASFFAGCLANSQLLGLNPHDIMRDEALSPFAQRAQEVGDQEESFSGHRSKAGALIAVSK